MNDEGGIDQMEDEECREIPRDKKSRIYRKGIWPGFLGSGWLSWAVAKR